MAEIAPMVKRPAVLATDPPSTLPRPVVAVAGSGVVEGGGREELIPVGNEPVVDNEDRREDESGGNDPVKLEAAE